MEARIQKWGNSSGIRIPSSILKSLNIKTNDILNIEQKNDKIIISIPKKENILEDTNIVHGSVLYEYIRSIDYEKRDLKFVEKLSNNVFISVVTLLNACIEE